MKMGNIVLKHQGNIFSKVTRSLQMKYKTCPCHELFHLGRWLQNLYEFGGARNEDLQRKENNEKT